MVSDLIHSLCTHYIPVNHKYTSKLKEKNHKRNENDVWTFHFFGHFQEFGYWFSVCYPPRQHSNSLSSIFTLYTFILELELPIQISFPIGKVLNVMEPDRPGFQAQLHHLQMEIPQSSVKMSLSLSSLVYEMCIVSLNLMPVCKISIIFYLFLFFHEREGQKERLSKTISNIFTHTKPRPVTLNYPAGFGSLRNHYSQWDSGARLYFCKSQWCTSVSQVHMP